jgi:hypothetical protein
MGMVAGPEAPYIPHDGHETASTVACAANPEMKRFVLYQGNFIRCRRDDPVRVVSAVYGVPGAETSVICLQPVYMVGERNSTTPVHRATD